MDALVGGGHVILGVDARERNDAGGFTEVAISAYELTGDASDVENSRREALAAIARAEPVSGWEPPQHPADLALENHAHLPRSRLLHEARLDSDPVAQLASELLVCNQVHMRLSRGDQVLRLA